MMGFIELGDICSIKTGKLDANFAVESGIYPFFTCSKDSLWINDYSYDCECVLVAGNGDLNVKYYHGKFDAYQRTYIIEVKNGKKYNTKYLYLLLENSIDDLRRKSIGGVIKYIKLHDLSSIKVPIIDLVEQEKIVERIFKYKSLFDLKKDQIKKIDQIIKSQFVEMFGNPILNNKNNEVVKIEDIALKEKNAIKAGPFGSNLKKECYVSSGYKIYGQEQVIANDIKFGDYYIDEQKYNELISYAIKEDDILISLVGTYGKILIIPKLYEKGIINPRLMKISPNPKIINPYFFKILFDLMASVAKNYTHGGTMGILNVGIVKKMNIILPPIEEQKKYINIVNQIDKQKFELEKSLKKLEELQKSLMQEYFG